MPPPKGRKPAAAAKKKVNGYHMAPRIRLGQVITDQLQKKKWRIGPPLGTGGFGEIYSAAEVTDGSPKKSDNYCYAIKIEPHANGPLFVERTFYVRNAKSNSINSWMKEKKLTTFGMPTSFGNGSLEYEGEMCRYLVLERYGKDIWSLFKENNRKFPVATVFQLGLQMIDVLEYIHHQGYVHADIKGANMLLGRNKGTENQVYLVDYGLACRAALDREFKPNPKCAHNGTIEYTSRDAHLGVSTMRGDLEILGYNMVQWLAGELPWEKELKNPKRVQEMKEAFMKNVRAQCKAMKVEIPEPLIKYLEYINTLEPKEVPDYEKCRQFFLGYLKKEGKTSNSKLEFTSKGSGERNSAKAAKPSDSGDVNDKGGSDSGATKPKRGRKAAVKKIRDDEEKNDIEAPEDEVVPKKKPKQVTKVKQTKKPGSEIPELDNNESKPSPRAERSKKRKSSDPALLIKVKKTKLAPKATPPAKENHMNAATQTPVGKRQSSRHVSFESPIEGNSVDIENNQKSVNSSGDIFDDTFEIEEKKVKPKRKLLAKEEVIVKRVVKKKTTVQAKGKSWKDMSTITNGRSPPK